jgi:hypothetical protein
VCRRSILLHARGLYPEFTWHETLEKQAACYQYYHPMLGSSSPAGMARKGHCPDPAEQKYQACGCPHVFPRECMGYRVLVLCHPTRHRLATWMLCHSTANLGHVPDVIGCGSSMSQSIVTCCGSHPTWCCCLALPCPACSFSVISIKDLQENNCDRVVTTATGTTTRARQGELL